MAAAPVRFESQAYARINEAPVEANDGVPLQEQVDATTATKMAKQFAHYIKLAQQIAMANPERAEHIVLKMRQTHAQLPSAIQKALDDIPADEFLPLTDKLNEVLEKVQPLTAAADEAFKAAQAVIRAQRQLQPNEEIALEIINKFHYLDGNEAAAQAQPMSPTCEKERQGFLDYLQQLVSFAAANPDRIKEVLYQADRARMRFNSEVNPTVIKAMQKDGSFMALILQIARGGNFNPKG